ncbi:hypothetical protein B4N89_45465 [Embleya scabrispora]|uniref:ISL3 family transposase n=1 Tax=Embleya scabrispora TaxID=159449 RepID=A0A1T3NIR4_9ACTN|nr:ISL3 family transposase [Embleya scabrispora]OPC76737.1 hypothetical protein B4N89_45465 [Embleya scabrispora]
MVGARGFWELVWPEVEGLVVDGARVVGEMLRIDAHGGGSAGLCPACRCEATRVHDVYTRRLADRPLGGRRVVVFLRVRRFRCDEVSCWKRTFVEQIARLTTRYGRLTDALARMVQAIGVAVGGRAGARLATHLGVRAGHDSIVRRLRKLPDPPSSSVRVLGVDEFAFRRGRTYGTILIDVETHRPIDLLPDRSADTFAAWLAEHPEVEIICRDRCRVFGEGGRRGAPQAEHVADRWHLLHSLTSAVERTAHAHRACLRKDVEYTVPEVRDEAVDLANARALIESPPPMDPPGNQILARTRQRHADVHDLRERGYTISAIGRVLGLDRKTVRRFATTDLDELLASARVRRTGEIDRFRAYLQHRFHAGATNAAGLFREIHEQGYRGSRVVVTKYVATMRSGTAVPEARRVIPSPRRITSWIMRRPENLGDNERSDLDRVLAACPDLATAHALAGDFAAITRERRGSDLPDWVARVLADGPQPLQSFAISLQTDWDAVVNGPTLQWSSGAVEGQVNRIKFLKRRSYGRASFELLRTLVLAQPP